MHVRLGLIGAGLVARIHRDSLASATDQAVWAGVYDIDARRAERFARETGAKLCRTETELLEVCDAVYVCSWTAEHVKSVMAAAERKVPVYCEKPLAISLEVAKSMTATVEATGTINQAGLVLRHSPAFYWLRHLISDKRSGRLMSISFRDDQYLPITGHYDSTWRSNVHLAGAGVLLEHSIHDLDMLEYLGGAIQSISCQSASIHGIAGIEDAVCATFRYNSGVPGNLMTVWHDVLQRLNERRVEVFCENLWCALDGHHRSGPVHWRWADEPEQSAKGERLTRLAHEAGQEISNPDLAFVCAVQTGKQAYPDFRVAVRAHTVVEAAYRSATDFGRVIDLPFSGG